MVKRTQFFATSVIFVFFCLIMRKDLLQMSLMLAEIEFRRKTGTFLSHVSHRSLHGYFYEVKLQMSEK